MGAAAGRLRTMSDEVELRTAWSVIDATPGRSWEVFDDLIARHRQPHRRYHGVRHIVWVLRHVHELQAAIPECRDEQTYDATAVEAAAFFHDAIYEPERDDNEERSAVLAEHQLASLGWDDARVRVVAALVRETATHVSDGASMPAVGAPAPRATERHVLLDADLAVLGSEPAAYAAYSTGVRAEYAHVPDVNWQHGRAVVLRRLLERASIYGSAPARQWWETRARANLTAELASLAG
jgi:predicted metal-dependent HD superfamily phosphohydrolase